MPSAPHRKAEAVEAGAVLARSRPVVAVLTVITLLLLTGLFEKLPQATLAQPW